MRCSIPVGIRVEFIKYPDPVLGPEAYEETSVGARSMTDGKSRTGSPKASMPIITYAAQLASWQISKPILNSAASLLMIPLRHSTFGHTVFLTNVLPKRIN